MPMGCSGVNVIGSCEQEEIIRSKKNQSCLRLKAKLDQIDVIALN